MSIFVLAIALMSGIVVYSLTPVYRSATVLLIDVEDAKVVSIDEIYETPGANKEYLQTQLQILKSRDLAERVFNDLKLAHHPQYTMEGDVQRIINFAKSNWGWLVPDKLFSYFVEGSNEIALSERERYRRFVRRFMQEIKVWLVPGSNIIKISFESHYPELAANVPNALANSFINSFIESNREVTQSATSWIIQRTAELRENLRESEHQLQRFVEEEELINAGGVDSIALAARELDLFSTKLVDARREWSETRALYEQVQAIRNNPAQLESIPAVVNNPSVQRPYEARAEAEREVSALSKQYGSKHPDLIAARAQLNTAETNLIRQIHNIAKSLSNEVEAASAEVTYLESTISRIKDEIKDLNKKSYQLSALEQEVESNRQLYEVFLKRLKETNATSDLQTVNARIVDAAVVPLKPVWPLKGLIIVTSGIVAMVLGFAFVLLKERVDNTFKIPGEIEDRLNVPVLGVLLAQTKRYKQDKHINMVRYRLEPNSAFAESLRGIRTGILLSNETKAQKVILITSSIPGEGKSVISSNLACALAQMNSVVLLEADMRRPTIADAYALEDTAHGLAELLAGSSAIQDCVHPTDFQRLHVVPAGMIPPDPLELLSTPRFRKIVEYLKNKFEFVIIDSAPVLAVADSRILSTVANSLIYVIKAESTQSDIVNMGLNQLRDAGASNIGVVLNQATARKSKYGFYNTDYQSQYVYRTP